MTEDDRHALYLLLDAELVVACERWKAAMEDVTALTARISKDPAN